MRIFLTTWFCLLLATLPLRAEIAGKNDPAFQSAMAVWLEGQDMPALTALSDLAQADNRAAQVFLGVLSTNTWAHTHVTADMDRKARNALLKAPGGLSGKSWLSIAASDTPLAQHLQVATKPYADQSTAIALFEAGEYDRALSQMFGALNSGGFADAFDIALLPEALPLTHGFLKVFEAELAATEAQETDLRARIAELGDLSPAQRAMWAPRDAPLLWQDPEQNKDLLIARGTDLAEHPMIAPLVVLIDTECPGSGALEVALLQDLSRNFPVALLTRSPVESLLPSDVYLQSPRLARDIARRASLRAINDERAARLMPCLTSLR